VVVVVMMMMMMMVVVIITIFAWQFQDEGYGGDCLYS